MCSGTAIKHYYTILFDIPYISIVPIMLRWLHTVIVQRMMTMTFYVYLFSLNKVYASLIASSQL